MHDVSASISSINIFFLVLFSYDSRSNVHLFYIYGTLCTKFKLFTMRICIVYKRLKSSNKIRNLSKIPFVKGTIYSYFEQLFHVLRNCIYYLIYLS